MSSIFIILFCFDELKFIYFYYYFILLSFYILILIYFTINLFLFYEILSKFDILFKRFETIIVRDGKKKLYIYIERF